MYSYMFTDIHKVPNVTDREGYMIIHSEISSKLRSAMGMESAECPQLRSLTSFNEINFVTSKIPESMISSLTSALMFKTAKESSATMPIIRKVDDNRIAILYKGIQVNLFTVENGADFTYASLYYSYDNAFKYIIALARRFGMDVTPDGIYADLGKYDGEEVGRVKISTQLRSLFKGLGLSLEVFRFEMHNKDQVLHHIVSSMYFSREVFKPELDTEFPGEFTVKDILDYSNSTTFRDKIDFEMPSKSSNVQTRVIQVMGAKEMIDKVVESSKAKRLLESIVNAAKFTEILKNKAGFDASSVENFTQYFKARKVDLLTWLVGKSDKQLESDVVEVYDEWAKAAKQAVKASSFMEAMNKLGQPAAPSAPVQVQG